MSESVLPVAERRKARIEAYSVIAASATSAPTSEGVGMECYISYNAGEEIMVSCAINLRHPVACGGVLH